MPWKETRVQDQRVRFVVAQEAGEESMARLCRQFGISRKTGYKWLERWRAEGAAGLADRSRAPGNHPNAVAVARVEAILAARDRWGWGPKKLRVVLAREHPEIVWPALSTIQQILRDHGRVHDRKKRRRVPVQAEPLAHCDGPNSVWCCDFKGHFAVGSRRCHPLTITDGFSRYLLRCQSLARTDGEAVRPIFVNAFGEFGLPQAIRSDNGTPFASRAVAGLSRLSIWWIKLGIRPERIQPGQPQQNGRHERMHLTLKQETASPPATTFRRQQQRFETWRATFNNVRPHEALDMQTPASQYTRSPRKYPARIDPPEYPDGWPRRKVQVHGDVSWKHTSVFVSEVLRGETIGLEPIDDRYWRAYFGPVWLGVLDGHHRQMLPPAQLRRRRDLHPPQPADATQARPSAALQDGPASP